MIKYIWEDRRINSPDTKVIPSLNMLWPSGSPGPKPHKLLGYPWGPSRRKTKRLQTKLPSLRSPGGALLSSFSYHLFSSSHHLTEELFRVFFLTPCVVAAERYCFSHRWQPQKPSSQVTSKCKQHRDPLRLQPLIPVSHSWPRAAFLPF